MRLAIYDALDVLRMWLGFMSGVMEKGANGERAGEIKPLKAAVKIKICQLTTEWHFVVEKFKSSQIVWMPPVQAELNDTTTHCRLQLIAIARLSGCSIDFVALHEMLVWIYISFNGYMMKNVAKNKKKQNRWKMLRSDVADVNSHLEFGVARQTREMKNIKKVLRNLFFELILGARFTWT